jgi:hypothetical protein
MTAYGYGNTLRSESSARTFSTRSVLEAPWHCSVASGPVKELIHHGADTRVRCLSGAGIR